MSLSLSDTVPSLDIREVQQTKQTLTTTLKANEALLQAYLKQAPLVSTSFSTYERGIRLFFEWLEKTECDIKDCNLDLIRIYRNYLVNHPDFADSTAYTYFVTVKSLFTWLESRKMYPNVARSAQMPKVDRTPRKYPFSVGEVQGMLESFNQNKLLELRNYTIILCLATTGLRVTELTMLTDGDLTTRKVNVIDEHGESVEVEVHIAYVKGKGRQSKNDWVKLDTKTYAAIKRYMMARDADYLERQSKFPERHRTERKASDPLFVSHGNRNRTLKHITTRNIQIFIKDAMKRAGIAERQGKLTAHSLRYFFGTETLRATKDISLTQNAMRHKSANNTKIYTFFLQEEIRLTNNQEVGDLL